MKIYADTSFLVRLLSKEPGTTEAVAEYRNLGLPPLFFVPLHGLEIGNAIRQRAFYLQNFTSSPDRNAIIQEREAALTLLRRFISRGAFVETSVDLDRAISRARGLSERHTDQLGCRDSDLLHVALALELECDTFLTTDSIQAELAHAEGLDVKVSAG